MAIDVHRHVGQSEDEAMDGNMERLAALGLAVLLSYGWLLLPRSWRSYDDITVEIRCGTLLAFLLALGPIFTGAATLSGLGTIALIFYILPWLTQQVAYQEDKIPFDTYAAGAAAVRRYRR